MADFSRKMTERKMWLRLSAVVLFAVFWLCGGFGCREVSARTETAMSPIGTTIKLVIPDAIADKTDDTMTVRITNYSFSASAGAFDLNIDFMFNFLGILNKKGWESAVVFYDHYGNVLNRQGQAKDDGYIWSYANYEPANMTKTFSDKITVPAAYAGNVAAIVFQEHFHEPVTLPADPSMGNVNPWDGVNVNLPGDNIISSVYDSTMRAKITGFQFQNSESGQGYLLYISMILQSLGKTGGVWTGRVQFYDAYGNLLGGGSSDYYGYYGENVSMTMGTTYSFAIMIPENMKGRLSSIVFPAAWGNNTTPANTPSANPSGNSGEKKSQSVKAKNLKKILTGKSFKLSVGGSYYTTLSFKSSDKKIASVSKKGVVKMKKLGNVKITITAPGNAQYKQAKKTITLTIIPATPKISISVKNGVMTIKWNKVKGAAWYCCNVDWGTGSSKMTKKWSQRRGPAEKGKTYTITVTAQEKEENAKFKSKSAKKKVKVS